MIERLTVRTLYGCKFKGLPPYVNKPDKNKLLSEVAARLAAYEDSGLSPEEVQEQQGYIKTLETTDKGEQARRIIELEEALKKIANPILYMKKEAKEAKGVLDGVMALNLIKEPSYYREIAEKALLGGTGDE